MICDLSAIGYVGSEKRYFTTIFEMSQKSQGIKAYRAACLFESQDSLEQRIYYAMMYRKQKKIKYVAVIAMTVIFCGMSVTSTLAVSNGYQKVYTKWVQETEIEEEADIAETEEVSYEEKRAILKDEIGEKIKKINMKNNDVRTLKESIKSGKRIRYKKIYAKQNQVIEISVAGDKKFQNIKVGIADKNNNIRYIQDNKVEEVIHAFIIKKRREYITYLLKVKIRTR